MYPRFPFVFRPVKPKIIVENCLMKSGTALSQAETAAGIALWGVVVVSCIHLSLQGASYKAFLEEMKNGSVPSASKEIRCSI